MLAIIQQNPIPTQIAMLAPLIKLYAVASVACYENTTPDDVRALENLTAALAPFTAER